MTPWESSSWASSSLCVVTLGTPERLSELGRGRKCNTMLWVEIRIKRDPPIVGQPGGIRDFNWIYCQENNNEKSNHFKTPFPHSFPALLPPQAVPHPGLAASGFLGSQLRIFGFPTSCI